MADTVWECLSAASGLLMEQLVLNGKLDLLLLAVDIEGSGGEACCDETLYHWHTGCVLHAYCLS